MRSIATLLSILALSQHSLNGAVAQTVSIAPSGSPSLSDAPSRSSVPSSNPSGSSSPSSSDVPSIGPSVSPSIAPSGSTAPSALLSQAPSGQPSGSDAPTGLPTKSPTQAPVAFVKENDVCIDAKIVAPNGIHHMVDLTDATPDKGANGGACRGITIGDTPGLWFAVEGTGQTLRASTCHPETQVKVKITLFSTLDSSCNTLSCEGVSLQPDFECSMTTLSSQTDTDKAWRSPSSKVDFPTIPGIKYYLLVQQNSIVETGKVHLSIRPVTAPQHDNCVDALGPLPRDGTMVSQTSLDASITSVIAGYCNLQPSRYPGVWYQFIGNGGKVELNACAFNNFDGFYFSVYEGGDCDGLTCVDDVVEATIENDGECFFRTSAPDQPVTGVQRDKFQAVVSTTDGSRYYVYLHFAKTEQDTVTSEDVRFSILDVDGSSTSAYGTNAIKFRDSQYGMGSYVAGKVNQKNFFEDSSNKKTTGGGGGGSSGIDDVLQNRVAAVASFVSFALMFM
ncbi:unnamed protein product [Cylindrotheca closterium]|uniref:Secreted protein n=1 Tax=Cylindrotheca closterium TaxID=2856 RepID=A0AAD2G7P7_9STRA|nr:unnamed protein product [Cylindrotheca closterium]